MSFRNTAGRVLPRAVVMAGLGLLGLMPASLSFAQTASPWALATADFDNDQKADLAVSQPGQLGVSIFLSSGQTIQVPLNFSPTAIGAGDVNGDGRPDLVLAAPGYIAVLVSNGDGTFRDANHYPTPDVTLSLAVGDLNGDGLADIIVLGARQRTTVFLMNTDGTTQAPVSYALGNIPTAVALGDFNRDGRLDLVVGDAGTNQVLLAFGNGDGTFESANGFAAGPLPRSLAVGDFNGDGIADVAVLSLGDGNIRILLGTALGRLELGDVYDAGTGWTSIIAADIQGHRTLDLVWANSKTGALTSLSGRGDGTFNPARPLKVGAVALPRVLGSMTSLTTSPSGSATFGQQVTLTATVSPSAATGKVTFYDGANILGIGTVSGGVAAIRTSLMPSGSNSLSALYSGDSTYSSSHSSPVTLNVNAHPGGALTNAPGSPDSLSGTPFSMAVGDFNGDGNADLVTVNLNNATGNILLGNGNGSFTASQTINTGRNPSYVAIGDFNGDGKQDLAVANALDNNIAIYLGNGNGTFQTPTTIPVGNAPSAIAVVDLNGDGKADLAVANSADNTIMVLLGNGNGTFQVGGPIGVGNQPLWIGTGDFNSDGIPDLVVANGGTSGNSVTVLLSNGSGGFVSTSTLPTGATPQGGVVGDFNKDGKADFAVANFGSNNITVFLGNGNGTFSSSTVSTTSSGGTNPTQLAIGDFNGDGNPDLAVVNAGSVSQTVTGNIVTILLGNGSGGFTPTSFGPTAGSNPIAGVVADFNNDGRADLAVANYLDSKVSVFLGGVALGFFTVPPCRLIDTRSGQGKSGQFGPPPLNSTNRDFPFLNQCNISPNALAYSTNVTVVPQGALQFLSAWPSGEPFPGVSTLNAPNGNVLANAAILPGGASGNVTFVASSTTNLIVDVNGYFAPPTGSELLFFPIAPCRIADTRTGQNKTGPYGPPSLVGGPNSDRNFPIGGNCNIPNTAAAFSLNFTAVPIKGTPVQFVSAFPSGTGYPGVSTLNSSDGNVIANAAIVPAGVGGQNTGQIDVLASNATDIIIDANGYFGTGAGGLHFYPMTPCRVVDTRQGQGHTGQFGPPSLAALVQRDFQIQASTCSVPMNAQAYSLNVTALPVNSQPLGFLSIWPGGQGYPGVSTLNSPSGAVIANAAIVPAGTSQGDIIVLADKPTDLLIDINGYFAP